MYIFSSGLLLASLSLGAMLGKAKTAIERWSYLLKLATNW